MAHIPADDVRQLFNENKGKSWRSFHTVLEQHKGKANGIEDSVVDLLLLLTPHFEESKLPYPISAEEMQRMIESEIAAITARA
mgnify:CR=1 FL=1